MQRDHSRRGNQRRTPFRGSSSSSGSRHTTGTSRQTHWSHPTEPRTNNRRRADLHSPPSPNGVYPYTNPSNYAHVYPYGQRSDQNFTLGRGGPAPATRGQVNPPSFHPYPNQQSYPYRYPPYQIIPGDPREFAAVQTYVPHNMQAQMGGPPPQTFRNPGAIPMHPPPSPFPMVQPPAFPGATVFTPHNAESGFNPTNQPEDRPNWHPGSRSLSRRGQNPNQRFQDKPNERRRSKSFQKEVVSSEDEADGYDYTSELNVMQQKGMISSFTFVVDSQQSTRFRAKYLLVRLKVKLKNDADVLTSESTSRVLKKAKQKASRKMVDILKDHLKESDAGYADTQSTSTGQYAALLNTLVQKRIIPETPAFEYRSYGSHGEEREAIIMFQLNNGRQVTLRAHARNQKMAKNDVCKQALQMLKENGVEGVPDIEEERILPEYETPVDEDVVVDNSSEGGEGRGRCNEECFVDSHVAHTLPCDYAIRIVRSEQEFRVWIGKNATTGSSIGVYIDSLEARDFYERHGTSERRAMVGNTFVCLSTQNSGVIIALRRLLNSQTKVYSNEIHIKTLLKEVLENANIKKYTWGWVNGAIILDSMHNIKIQSPVDIAVRSQALKGWSSMSGGSILPNLPQLCKLWLGKEFVLAAGTPALRHLSVPLESFENRDTVAQGTICAQVCACISKKMEEIGFAFRARGAEDSGDDAFDELQGRLETYVAVHSLQREDPFALRV